MYYLLDNNSIKYIYIKYYIGTISKEDFTDSFKMYITDDIQKDFLDFDNRKINTPKGLVLFPDNNTHFISLISYDSGEDAYFHELTHLYGGYLFKKHFKCKNNQEIKKHKYLKLLLFGQSITQKQ